MLPFESEQDLTFVHAGANDGQADDWLYASVTKNRWQGLCLEPQARIFERLRKTYAGFPGVTPIKGALSSQSGRRVLYGVRHPDPRLDVLCDKLASFDRELLVRNARQEFGKFPELEGSLAELDAWITEETVPCYTLEELLAGYRLQPDLVSLDIEGHEAEVVTSIDFARIRPKYVFFETYHMPAEEKSACLSLLRENGYATQWVEEYGVREFNVLGVLVKDLMAGNG